MNPFQKIIDLLLQYEPKALFFGSMVTEVEGNVHRCAIGAAYFVKTGKDNPPIDSYDHIISTLDIPTEVFFGIMNLNDENYSEAWLDQRRYERVMSRLHELAATFKK